MHVVPKQDSVEQTSRSEPPTSEGRDPQQRQLGFVPTQPDLRLSFPNFFTKSVPWGNAAELASAGAVDSRHAPRRAPNLDAAPEELGDLLLRPMLMRLDGAASGELFPLERGEIALGRGAECEIRVDDNGVGYTHASIFRSDGAWYLKDLGTATGTRLNDRRVHESQQLGDGAIICLAPGVTFVFQRIDARYEATLRQLYEGMYRDALTGAHNRRYLDERLCAEVAFSVRHQRPLALVVLAIDGFRQKHRKRGSDLVLQRVAECIRALLRLEDVFGRCGRAEFALVLREADSFTAGTIAERLRKAVQDAGERISISAGCALLDECETQNAASLMARAKQRLAEATAKGGNRVVIA